MKEVWKVLEEVGSPTELESEVHMDLSARCAYIAYNAVKQMEILTDNMLCYKATKDIAISLREDMRKEKVGWMWLALGSIAVNIIITFIVLST